jgi:hypothetical protein
MKNDRRSFLKLTQAAALPVSVALATNGVARADDDDFEKVLGSWNTKHTLPQPPGAFFREFLSFSSGGVVQETNAYLHTASNLDFRPHGFNGILNASDGFGNWKRIGNRRVAVAFRKMLFDTTRGNIADLRAHGTLSVIGNRLTGSDWTVEIVEPFSNKVLHFLGAASTEGWRID